MLETLFSIWNYSSFVHCHLHWKRCGKVAKSCQIWYSFSKFLVYILSFFLYNFWHVCLRTFFPILAQKWVARGGLLLTLGGGLFDLFRDVIRKQFFDAFGSHFGSLWAPCGSLWVPFGLILAPFGFPFGSFWLPLARFWFPSGSFWVHFSSFSTFLRFCTFQLKMCDFSFRS